VSLLLTTPEGIATNLECLGESSSTIHTAKCKYIIIY
jgi:hypothetical protein